MMDQELNRLLFELLAVLSDATKKISEILCRQAGGGGAPLAAAQVAEEIGGIARGIGGAASALDRVQEDSAAGEDDGHAGSSGDAAPGMAAPRRRGKLAITEDELRRLYVEEDLPARIIAERFGVSAATINLRLRTWGIGKRARRSPDAAPGEDAETAKGECEERADRALPATGVTGFEPDPAAMDDADAAFSDEEAPKDENGGSGGETPRKSFRLIGRRR